jgi:hypothetical protein
VIADAAESETPSCVYVKEVAAFFKQMDGVALEQFEAVLVPLGPDDLDAVREALADELDFGGT